MKLVDFIMTRLFKLAEYVCGRYSLSPSEPAAATPQEARTTIRFSNEDKVVEGELFS